MKEEFYDKIKSVSLKELNFLVTNILNEDYSVIEGEKKKDTLDNIINRFSEDENFLNFLDLLTSLNDISVNKAKDFIVEQKIAPIDLIKSIRRKSTLLIFLYEHDFLDHIELITFFSEINKYTEEWNYFIDVKLSNELNETIESSLKDFYEEWNKNNLKKIFAYQLPSKEESFLIKIIKEIGYRNQNQFLFRKVEVLIDNLPEFDKFKVKRLVSYPVSYKKIIISQIEKDKYELTFYFDIKRERNLVESFLTQIFGIELKNQNLINKKSKTTKIIEKSAEKIYFNAGENSFEKSKNKLEELKNNALEKIKNSMETTENKKEIEEITKQIYILPPKIYSAPEKGIINIEIDVKPNDFYSETSCNKITHYLFEIAKELDNSQKTYLYYINGKKIEIQSGKLEQTIKNLDENEQKAIHFIFGELNE